MAAPAARVGDMTNHGTPLGPGPGTSTVLIGGRPAWRAIVDVHTCPAVDGVRPHIGGVVNSGSATVFVAGQPAARAGDMIIEAAGFPNTILAGTSTVLIG